MGVTRAAVDTLIVREEHLAMERLSTTVASETVRMVDSIAVRQRNIVDDFQALKANRRQSTVARFTGQALLTAAERISLSIVELSGERRVTMRAEIAMRVNKPLAVVEEFFAGIDLLRTLFASSARKTAR